MVRKARIDAPGALHHIICRGIERKRIFRDNKDRNNFVERLGNILLETSTSCYAWSLIPNHFHLLLKTGLVPISTVMRRLLTGYAITFNRRHHRHGHLFQNRYKSILCQEEIYLLELVRYIHLNPLRAKQCIDLDKLSRFSYSGHSRLMGHFSDEWQDTEEILLRFEKNIFKAREKYASFVKEGFYQGRKPELTGGGLVRSNGGWKEIRAMRDMNLRVQSDERILGDSDFVDIVLKKAEEAFDLKQQYRLEGFDFDKALELTAKIFNLEKWEISTPGKQPQRVKARSLLCYWSVKELGLTVTSVAEKLGLKQPAISRAVHRGERLAQDRSYSLKELIKA